MWKLSLRPLVIMMFACGLFGVVDTGSAPAQGLFRRLQSRVQSRIGPVTPNPNAPAQNAPTAPATDGAAAQRLSPLNGNRDQGSQGGPGTQPIQGTGAARSVGGATSRSGSRFGGSILAKPALNDASADSPDSGSPTDGSSRPSMGIQVVASTEGTPGLKVAGIRPGSKAREAGLREDDLIVAIDGKATPTVEAIAEILEQRKAGDTLRATVLRGESAAAVMIPLIDRRQLTQTAATASEGDSTITETAQAPGALQGQDAGGLAEWKGSTTLGDFGADVKASPGQRGVVISNVVSGSSAESAGLRVGDRIVSINGRLMLDEATFQREWTRHALGDELSINAVRDETLNTYDVVLRARPDNDSSALAQTDSPLPDLRDLNATGQPEATDKPAPTGSVLGGIGSVIGGLFGGPAETDTAASKTPDRVEDTMDLNDGESIQRVGFEREIDGDSRPLPSDPPSVEELTPPVADPTTSVPVEPGDQATPADAKDQLIESLRDEIRRLRQRLNELEEDQP